MAEFQIFDQQSRLQRELDEARAQVLELQAVNSRLRAEVERVRREFRERCVALLGLCEQGLGEGRRG